MEIKKTVTLYNPKSRVDKTTTYIRLKIMKLIATTTVFNA